MNKLDKCRAKATECDYRAQEMNDTFIRAELRDIARQWRGMANQIEQLEREQWEH